LKRRFNGAVYRARLARGADFRLRNLQKSRIVSENCKMYVRYIAKYFNQKTNREETGIFRAADYVRDHTPLGAAEKEALQKLIEWFDEHLPVPEFYDDPSQRSEEQHTYFWFKTDAREFLDRMEFLRAIVEENGVRVETLRAERVPGALVFEDHCQIAVVPAEEVFRVK
jgi:hypothetical protein